MKKLGFGLMRLPLLNPDDSSSIDIETTKKMVDTFIERGFTYFDTAWMYCKGKSETAVKAALVDRYPRDSYTLATKLHASFVETKEDRDRIFAEQLAKTGVDYFDYYLIHDIETNNYDKYTNLDCFNWIIGKKNAGLAKHIGFSFHSDAAMLDRVLTEHPEFEFVQLQINYLDWENERIQSRLCYEVARKHGKPIIVMEPVKGGKLANIPEEAKLVLKAAYPDATAPSLALRFVAELDGVMMILSGMSNMAQMNENVDLMSDPAPLTDGERRVMDKICDIINGKVEIPCTGCSYCTDGCPAGIPIPRYLEAYNKSLADPKGGVADYEQLIVDHPATDTCIECGQCEGVCPQHLPIIAHLKDTKRRLG